MFKGRFRCAPVHTDAWPENPKGPSRPRKALSVIPLRKSTSAMALGLALVLALAWAAPARCQESSGVDWQRLSRVYPHFKTIVRLSFAQPLDLGRLLALYQHGAAPIRGDMLAALGERRAVFFTRAGNLEGLRASGLAQRVEPLSCFSMSALYRVHFKVRDQEYGGPLSFMVSTPRGGWGKTLLSVQDHLYPNLPFTVRQDQGGNRWMVFSAPAVRAGDEFKCDFYATYRVDVAKLLRHALLMLPPGTAGALPAGGPAREFLAAEPKIDPASPPVRELAGEIFGGATGPRRLWGLLAGWLKDNVRYDHAKRAEFFGGRMVYRNMAEMYQVPELTLERRVGACPDTSVLEAALLRAGGVPARTAGRWGHFYAEVYAPPAGWLSTSVTPTGIPLVKDPGPRHQPFVSWDPPIAVQTTRWTGRVKIYPEE